MGLYLRFLVFYLLAVTFWVCYYIQSTSYWERDREGKREMREERKRKGEKEEEEETGEGREKGRGRREGRDRYDGGETNNTDITEFVKGINGSRASTQEMCPFPLRGSETFPAWPWPQPSPGPRRLKKYSNAIVYREARVCPNH